MSLDTRLAKVEKITTETALALIERAYGVTAADLEGMKEICVLMNAHSELFDHKEPADILAAFTKSVREAIQQAIDDPEGRTHNKLLNLWQRAGLDIHN